MPHLIFVVEDESSFKDVYARLFEMTDSETAEWSFSGEDAIEKMRNFRKKPDLVIMDHRLPHMNGVDTMNAIHRIDPSIKVLFISADEKAKKMALDNGAVAFIQKPFSIAEFVRIVKENL